MQPRSWRIALSLLVATVVPVVALAKKENPLERMLPVPANEQIPALDFFRPRLFHNPELNPAGTHFAAIVSTDRDVHDLVCYDFVTKKFNRLTAGAGYDIVRYEWLNDKRLLFQVTKDKIYASGLHAVEVGRFAQSYVLQRYNVVVPVGFPKKTPLEAILWIKNVAAEQGSDGGVIRIDTRRSMEGQAADDRISLTGDSGQRADVVHAYPKPKGVPVAYIADKEGELAFALTSKEGVPTLHRLVDDRWEPSAIDLERVSILAPGDVPGELLVLGPREPGKPRGLYRYDTVANNLGELLYQDDRYDFAGGRIYRHPVDGRILGVQYNRKVPQSVWFDSKYQVVQAALEKFIPNVIVRIIGSDRAEKQFFVSASSDVQPPVYYHANLETKTIGRVTSVTPWIDPARMQPMKMLTYKTRDGFSVESYVTLPAGASKENPAPLVVLPHGGPWARDNWSYSPQVQFLASRGYAVFQPNYRGSTGYGASFPEGDSWAFRKMHDDVTDGVKNLLKTGVIDPQRVAIMGGSFGGYLALCGVVQEPDLYRCAITIAGVFDWERVVKDARSSEHFRGQYGLLVRKLGDPKKHHEDFEAISPINHVDAIKVPVFVAHGTEDVVATAAQSTRLIAELKKYGVPYEKQIEKGEGHGFAQMENQIELYTAVEAFLAKNLTPKPAAVAGVVH